MFDEKSILSRFTPAARSRRAEIEKEVRLLITETVDLDLGELRRLSRDSGTAAAALELVRQRVENFDFTDAMSLGVMALLIERVGPSAREGYAANVLNVLEVNKNQFRSLMIEYLGIAVAEFRRLGVENSGPDGMSFVGAAALIDVLRQQVETGTLGPPDEGGLLETLIDVCRAPAASEIERQARSN